MASLTTHHHSQHHYHNSLTSLFRSTDYQNIEKGVVNNDEQLLRSTEALLLQHLMQSGGDRSFSGTTTSSSMCNKRGNLDNNHDESSDHPVEAPDFKSASSAAAVAELLKTGTLFKSSDSIATFKDNDNAFKSVDISGVFKSQDSFINKLFKVGAAASSGGGAAPADSTPSAGKTVTGTGTASMLSNHSFPDHLLSASGTTFKSNASIFASRDWIPQFEPSHVDVDPKEVFQSDDGNHSRPGQGLAKPSSASASPDKRKRTDWEAMYESSLPSSVSPAVPNHYMTTTTTATTAATQPYVFPDVKPSSEERYPSRVRKNTSTTIQPYSSSAVLPKTVVAESLSSSLSVVKQQPGVSSREKSGSNNNNTSRNSNRKEPTVKVYYEPQDSDVLLGRGGRTNHHPGNKRYLEAKDLIQDRYLAASKNEKTDISQELVDVVHAWGGRFLQLDEVANKWFEVTNIKARKKASQTLREMNTPEQRAAKRAKYGK